MVLRTSVLLEHVGWEGSNVGDGEGGLTNYASQKTSESAGLRCADNIGPHLSLALSGL